MVKAAGARKHTAKTTAMAINLKATVSSKDSLNSVAMTTQDLVQAIKAMGRRKDGSVTVEKMKDMVGRALEEDQDMENKKDESNAIIGKKRVNTVVKGEISTTKAAVKSTEKSMKDAAIIRKRKADTEGKAPMDNKAEDNPTSKEARATEKNTRAVASIVRRRVNMGFRGDRSTILGAAMG